MSILFEPGMFCDSIALDLQSRAISVLFVTMSLQQNKKLGYWRPALQKRYHKRSSYGCCPYVIDIVFKIFFSSWLEVVFSCPFSACLILIYLSTEKSLYLRPLDILWMSFFNPYGWGVVREVSSKSGERTLRIHCAIRVRRSLLDVLVCAFCPFTNCFRAKLLNLCCFSCGLML